MKFRKLKPSEIDVRIGSINQRGATLLLYKDARVDQNILDESGLKWQRKHEFLNGNLFCTVSIWDEDLQQWISRQDVGIESYTEKEKGQASDSFKRACFNWGIGRELYSAPFIWVKADKFDMHTHPKTNKYSTFDKFYVHRISYSEEDGHINGLAIVNKNRGEVAFYYKEEDKNDKK